ncbi:hypothetical protein [Burkholderia vietnamiensis]|uniref:hypothetical protein n=1 Tax=Burkholderia vietnamiensis TaxID=60552 RepID=UPI001E2A14D3|nr:hypothetical protein [Burkholderia vietnamiensis]
MTAQNQSCADALTEAQRKALETAVNVLNINWEHETANELWEAFTVPPLQPAAAPIARLDPDAVTRLKAICRKLGIESTIPEEVYGDPEGLFVIFGRVRDAITRMMGPTPSPSGALHALRAAKQFIANGVELGYIRMPDSDCPDPAHEVPQLIDAAIASLNTAPSPAGERAAPEVPEKRDATDPEEQWQQFWKEICTNDDGSINLEQVKKELSDFSMLLSWVPRVYMHVTGGKVSKVNTWPSVVTSLHDEHMEELVEEALQSERDDRAASANETGAEGTDAFAHEVWSAAQRAPGEGIEDAVQRIAAILSRSPAMAAEAVAHVPIHPKRGPLWANTVATLDADRPAYYPTRALYFAPPPAQAAMPVLTDAMRAVITNESGAYQSADDLYAALCAAADDERPAQADARVGLTDEQREAIQRAVDYADMSDRDSDAEALRALLQGANHD